MHPNHGTLQHKTSQTQSSDRLTAMVWAKLAARYGARWTSQWSDPRINSLAQAEWTQKLSRYSESAVVDAIDRWMDSYPPTLPDLLNALRVQTAAHKAYKQIDPPTPDKAKGLKALKEARQKIDEQSEPEAHKAEIRTKPAGPDWFESRGWDAYKPGEKDLLKVKGLR